MYFLSTNLELGARIYEKKILRQWIFNLCTFSCSMPGNSFIKESTENCYGPPPPGGLKRSSCMLLISHYSNSVPVFYTRQKHSVRRTGYF